MSIAARPAGRSAADCRICSALCARKVTDMTLPDYGYRPAASALIERLATVLAH